MSKDTVISVILRLRDEMGGQARKTLDALTHASKGAAQGAGATAKALTQMSRSANEASGQLQAAGRATGAFRSDRVRQMVQHVAQLEREAKGSRRELDAAAKSGERLASSLSRVGGAGRAAWGAMRGIGQAGAGLAAGGIVAARTLEKPVSYESRLASMANVAFNEKDAAGRIEGMKKLDRAIQNGASVGGGTRENAAEALNTMLAQGMKEDTASRILPDVLKASTATGASANDLAKSMMSGMDQGLFTEDQVKEALDALVRGGELGKFEVKDMARWLPQIMSKAAGMKNMDGFKKLIADLQGIAVVSGSNDQAGNALFNLLGKITSNDTAVDAKKFGIDLHGTLAKAAEKGEDPLTAFVELVERKVVGKDKKYQAIKKKIAAAKSDEEKQALLGQAADILQAGALGKILQDREAALAYAGLTTQKGGISKVLSGIRNSKGAMDTGFDVVSGTSAFKLQQLGNEKDNAFSRVLEKMSGPFKAVLDSTTNLAREFPELTALVAGASSTFGTFAASFAGMGAWKMMAGGGAGATAAGIGLSGTAATLTSAAAKAFPGLTAARAFFDVWSTEKDETLTRAQKNINNTETYGATAAALAGAAMGGAMGSAFPVVGTAIGALLGGVAGWISGGMAGREVGKGLYGPSPETMEKVKEFAVKDERTINFDARLLVDGREMARVVNEHNASEAKRQ